MKERLKALLYSYGPANVILAFAVLAVLAIGLGSAALTKRRQLPPPTPAVETPTSQAWAEQTVGCDDGSQLTKKDLTREELEEAADKWGLKLVPARQAPRQGTKSGKATDDAGKGVPEAPGGSYDLKLAAEFGNIEILGEHRDERAAPRGVEILTVQTESGDVVPIVKAIPPKFFEPIGDWKFYAEAGPSTEGLRVAIGAELEAFSVGWDSAVASINGAVEHRKDTGLGGFVNLRGTIP